ncbi:MAG: CocE/NonD family hydrolase, partial [Ginsengibacter sp.]
MKINLLLICILISFSLRSQNINPNFVKENFTKIDTTITMRDGIKLYTVIYIPKDGSEKYPFLIERTPYSSKPYGENNYAR